MSFPWHHSRGTSYQIPFTRYRKETHSDKELRIAIQRSSICVSRFSSRFSLTLSPPSLSHYLSVSFRLFFYPPLWLLCVFSGSGFRENEWTLYPTLNLKHAVRKALLTRTRIISPVIAMLRRGFYKNGYSTMEIKRRHTVKKNRVLFSTVKTVRTQAGGMKTTRTTYSLT